MIVIYSELHSERQVINVSSYPSTLFLLTCSSYFMDSSFTVYNSNIFSVFRLSNVISVYFSSAQHEIPHFLPWTFFPPAMPWYPEVWSAFSLRELFCFSGHFIEIEPQAISFFVLDFFQETICGAHPYCSMYLDLDLFLFWRQNYRETERSLPSASSLTKWPH